ncbi:DUF4405 domain-containing protein [Sulfurimonas sp. HSL3-7]|uniref:DUF4405 domain-containing protein n=1 Tax=Sulfonitrofixus jiaomeiensis TaxID=3131938 RepID=UPI0031F95FBC
MKKITSLSLGLSFLIMSYTGIMLFLTPHGRVAYWSDWHLWGLTKTQYAELHTTSMLTFLFFGAWHIYYNWKPIISYLKDANRKISFTKREFVIALLINLFFVAGTLYPVHPMKAFLQMGDKIKESWAKQYGEPPYGHAEETKLRVLCQKLNIDLDQAKEILQKNNIVFKEDESLLTIAENNHMSPSDIFKLIRTEKPHGEDENIPSGLGRKTLQELSDMKKIDLNRSIELLKAKGIDEVTPDSKIKNIADELGVMPVEVYKLLADQSR